MYFVLFFFVCVDSCIVCDKQLVKPQLLSTHLPWDNWKSNPVIYSQLFKYTKQHTAGFTEKNWSPHLLRPALAISGFRRKHTCYHTFSLLSPFFVYLNFLLFSLLNMYYVHNVVSVSGLSILDYFLIFSLQNNL